MARVEHIEVRKTGRYYVAGHLGPNTKEIWIVAHGYGYLAEYFIKYFNCIANDTCCIIAPEGLNKFYKNGFAGDVGATWMTKSDRLHEIDDYVEYLDQLLELVMKDLDRGKVKLNVLGFSQGAAVVCRWLTKKSVLIGNLVIWAGDIPDDIDFNRLGELLNGKPVHLVVGDADEFVSEKMLEQFEVYLGGKPINYKLYRYVGGHRIHEPTLMKLVAQFRAS